MDFDDTPEEAAFRAKVRAWIRAHAPQHLEHELHRNAYSSESSFIGEKRLLESRKWQRQKAEGGYACLHWPKEYGGGGASRIEQVIWQQEEGAYSHLCHVFGIGVGMCGPTLIRWATEEHKGSRLPPIMSGEEIWCQLFSEPAGGSDLAALRTRAIPDPDGSGDWLVNGQKIWTSGAHVSDYGLLLTRTDWTVPKHKGLTMFFLNMKTPGVEIRPIKQINGASDFSEVFFTDVRIPDSNRLGAAGQGWEVSITTLMNERLSLGATVTTGFEELLAFCRTFETPDWRPLEDRAVRSKLARWAVRTTGLKYAGLRAMSAVSRGENPGPENAIGKLVAGATIQEVAAFALDLQDQAGILTNSEFAAAAGRFQSLVLTSPAMRIAGGTDEILRNIISERVLGLPSDIRVDKSVPFNAIPTSGSSSTR